MPKQKEKASGMREGLLAHIGAFCLLALAPIIPLFQRFLLTLLSVGPIPQHIGIIMDGNRRYARTRPEGPIPVSQGHLSGFNALRSVLESCLRLEGLEYITVYAFAMNNFARDKLEVDALMDLAKRNLIELAGHGEVLARHGARIRMVGRKELLPFDVQAALDKVETMTQRNKGATLNICIAYASSDEIAYSVNECVQRHKKGHPSGPINTNDLDNNMMLTNTPPVDIMVRTSGVRRLSDFLLWQTTHAQLQFTEQYWPLFGLKELVPIILDYQRMKIRQKVEDWIM